MDTNELKKLLKGSTAVLILDNGEPSFVILGYDSYKNLLFDQEKEVKINHSTFADDSQEKGQQDGRFDKSQTNKNSYKFQPNSARFQDRISEKETELLEKINKQILSLKNEVDREEKMASNPHID